MFESCLVITNIIGPLKQNLEFKIISYPSIKTYVLGAQKNRLNEHPKVVLIEK